MRNDVFISLLHGTEYTTPPPTSLNAPNAVDATNLSDTSFTANWSASIGATGYTFDVSTASNFVSGLDVVTDVHNVNSYPVTGLSDNSDYYYRVRAYNATLTSDWSNTISVHTNTTISNVYISSLGNVVGGSNINRTDFGAASAYHEIAISASGAEALTLAFDWIEDIFGLIQYGTHSNWTYNFYYKINGGSYALTKTFDRTLDNSAINGTTIKRVNGTGSDSSIDISLPATTLRTITMPVTISASDTLTIKVEIVPNGNNCPKSWGSGIQRSNCVTIYLRVNSANTTDGSNIIHMPTPVSEIGTHMFQYMLTPSE